MKCLNIALVAHDARKKELLEWFKFNVKTLVNHTIYATGTTGNLIINAYKELDPSAPEGYYDGYKVRKVLSGPLGGDQMIGAMIAQGQVDVLIFFCDNLITQGHQTDISALTRLASLYNIAFATNRTTADMILTSSLFANEEYVPIKQDFSNYLNRKI
jgi:methylglyoxal synthase